MKGILQQQQKIISIHAPARGATKNEGAAFLNAYISIHAPARGATRKAAIQTYSGIFQSTLPRGERPYHPIATQATIDFNPRSREGSDLLVPSAVNWSIISIHAPARGATTIGLYSAIGFEISIHAPARGATASGS